MLFYIFLFLVGFTSLTTQVVFLREFLVIFSGNELSIGIIISIWMIFVGLGAKISGRFINPKYFYQIIFLTCILLPFELVLMRFVRPVFQSTPFEMLDIIEIIVFSSIFLLPLCFLFGAWFVSATKTIFQNSGGVKNFSEVSGNSYFFEAIGSISGGIIASFFLIKYLSTFEILVLVSTVNLVVLTFLSRTRLTTGALVFLFLILYFTGAISKLDKFSVSCEWRPFNLVESKNSVYGNISVLKLNEEYNFYENGNKIFSTGDRQYSEEIVHFSVLSYPAKPKSILLVGGSISGNLSEVLKYPVERVVCIELDPLLIQIGKKYAKKEIVSFLNHLKVQIVYGDPRFYIKNTKEKFDCVILDIPDPTSLFINRYYTFEFFNEIRRILNPSGILMTGVSSSENYMSEELKILSSSIYKSIKSVYRDCKIIPGIKNYFVASDFEFPKDFPEKLIEKISNKKIDLVYLTPHYVRYLLRDDRVDRVKNWIKEKEDFSNINKDFYPVSYFYGLSYWLSYFNKRYSGFLYSLRKVNFLWVVSVIFLIFLVIFFVVRKNKKFYYLPVLVLVGITGFSAMVVELLLIFSFQIVYGYIYEKIGLLITSFMAGIAVGSFLSSKLVKRNLLNFVISVEIAFLFYSTLLTFLVDKGLPVSIWIFMIFLSGLPVGLVFPVANQIITSGESMNFFGKVIGSVYSFDLWGATLGSFLSSVFLLPVFGIIRTCNLLFFLILMSVILLTLNREF